MGSGSHLNRSLGKTQHSILEAIKDPDAAFTIGSLIPGDEHPLHAIKKVELPEGWKTIKVPTGGPSDLILFNTESEESQRAAFDILAKSSDCPPDEIEGHCVDCGKPLPSDNMGMEQCFDCLCLFETRFPLDTFCQSLTADGEVVIEIPGLPGYFATNQCNILSSPKDEKWGRKYWRRLPSIIDRDGYQKVQLERNGVKTQLFVHSLICLAFHGSRPSGEQCRHYPDPTKTNNKPENLCWGTQRENQWDQICL